MSKLKLTVLSLRYSSWSMRPWLALYHTGAPFETETVALPHMARQSETTSLEQRRALGSVRGLFPVLRVDGTPIHESLAICEYVADAFPDAHLWPAEPLHRAAARAICSEMVSGFSAMRNELSCHLFGRVPSFKPTPAAAPTSSACSRSGARSSSSRAARSCSAVSRSRTRCTSPC